MDDAEAAMRAPRVAFAGDRAIAVRVLSHILSDGVRPLVLLIGDDRASHSQDLREACPHLDDRRVLTGASFRTKVSIEMLRELELDYLISVHFPYVVPPEVLAIPRIGALNLHPAWLPYNRGWHTPTWAILDGTPYGATLHYMDAELDIGDVVHRRHLEIRPDHTADSLYAEVLDLEFEVFAEAWTSLREGRPPRTPQEPGGTAHGRHDLKNSGLQRLDLHERLAVGDVINRLRALTTNRLDEAAYFETSGARFRVRVDIVRDEQLNDDQYR